MKLRVFCALIASTQAFTTLAGCVKMESEGGSTQTTNTSAAGSGSAQSPAPAQKSNSTAQQAATYEGPPREEDWGWIRMVKSRPFPSDAPNRLQEPYEELTRQCIIFEFSKITKLRRTGNRVQILEGERAGTSCYKEDAGEYLRLADRNRQAPPPAHERGGAL
jgi:hypothetical protein